MGSLVKIQQADVQVCTSGSYRTLYAIAETAPLATPPFESLRAKLAQNGVRDHALIALIERARTSQPLVEVHSPDAGETAMDIARLAGLSCLLTLARGVRALPGAGGRSGLAEAECMIVKARADAAAALAEREGEEEHHAEVYLVAASDWASILTSQSDEAVDVLKRQGLDREDEFDRLVWIHGASRRLRRPFRTAVSWRPRAALLKWTREWFLPRFDLRRCAEALSELAQPAPSNAPQGRMRRMPPLGSLVSLPLVQRLFWVLLTLLLACALAFGCGTLADVAVLLAGSMIASVAVAALRTGLPLALPFLPRLGAGVAVGTVLVLTLPSELTGALVGSKGAPPPVWVCIALLAGVAALAWVYLLAEMSNRLAPFMEGLLRPRVLRTLHVLWIGVVQSLFAATLLSALLAAPVYGRQDTGELARLGRASWCLVVVPEYVLVGAAIALGGGVILQMLWEERVTTEPPI